MQENTWFDTDPERMPLGRLVSWTGQAVDRWYRRTVAAHGLSPTALAVLGVLAGTDAVSHRELAGRLGVTPATLTPVIDGLAETEELRRQRDPVDRRVVRLSITPRGRGRVLSTAEQVGEVLRDRLPHPPPEQRAAIRDYLLAVLAAVDDPALP